MSSILKSVEGARRALTVLGKVLSEHSSGLCLVASLVTGTATVVTACKATITVQPAIEEARACIADINEHAEEDVEYAETKKKNDLRKVKTDLAKTVAKELREHTRINLVELLNALSPIVQLLLFTIT